VGKQDRRFGGLLVYGTKPATHHAAYAIESLMKSAADIIYTKNVYLHTLID
jgi:hypothetical protein